MKRSLIHGSIAFLLACCCAPGGGFAAVRADVTTTAAATTVAAAGGGTAAAAAAAAAVERDGARAAAGSENHRQRLRRHHASKDGSDKDDANEDERRRGLLLERRLDEVLSRETCRNGRRSYGRCRKKILKKIIQSCDGEICFNRRPRDDAFYDRDGTDPEYYVDYDRAYCLDDSMSSSSERPNCDRCWKGRWCTRPQRCIQRKTYIKYKKAGNLDKICPGGWV